MIDPSKHYFTNQFWKDRYVAIIAELDSFEGICDLGCGTGECKSLVGDRPYVGLDIHSINPNVIESNIESADPFAAIPIKIRSAIASGLLEYLKDLNSFFLKASRRFDKLVYSWNDYHGVWPDLTASDVMKVASKYYTSIVCCREPVKGQSIWKCCNEEHRSALQA